MSSNMLRPKKTHRVRNFFLIVAALFVGIIVIANLQPAKHSTAPSQTTTQPAPAPAATSPEPAPTPVAATPEPSPAPAAATDYKISIATLVLEGSKVKVDIITNVPGEIEVVADLTIVGQAPDDKVIGTRGEYILIHNGEGQTILDGSTLPTGKYEVEVSLYPWWGLKDDVSKACGLKQDLGYSISARALVTLTGTGESAEVVKKRNQGQRWVMSNVFVGIKWDPSSWVAKFGSWKELKLTSGNPQILKMLYFESIDMTLTVNVLKGEIVTWQLGKASSQATTQPAPTPVAASPQPSPADAEFSIISVSTLHSIKRTVNVRLNQRVSEDVLHTIAQKLYVSGYDRTFILYWLPHMEVGTGAWATTHFNPNLEINILGLTPKQLKTLEALPSDAVSPQEVIGSWMWELPGGCSPKITIYQRNGDLYIEKMFLDGSNSTKELTERASSQGRRFEESDATYGDYCLLDTQGDLYLGDNEGVFEKLQKFDK